MLGAVVATRVTERDEGSMATIPSRTAIAVVGLRKSFGEQVVLDGLDLTPREQDLGPDAEAVGERADRLVRLRRRRLLQPVLRLVDVADLQAGEHQPPPEPDQGGPVPQPLQHRQRRQQVAPCLLAPLHLQAQLADPGVGARLQVRKLPLLERFQRPPGGVQRAVQVAHVLEEVADDAVGGTGHQRLVAVAQRVQGRAILGVRRRARPPRLGPWCPAGPGAAVAGRPASAPRGAPR